VKRAIVVAISVILALVVAAPIASGQSSSQSQNLGQLTAAWWNWNFSTNPSPLEGSYTDTDPDGSIKCDGNFVDGVFFLSGSLATDPETRTCTVPANTPILFSPFNYLCSEVLGDTPPLTECATETTEDTIDPPSKFYARVDGKDAKQRRIASGLFQWTIPDFPEMDPDNFLGIPPGTYPAAQDGLWVYLKNGLTAGKHKIVFGGTFEDTPFNTPENPKFKGARITYKLTAVNEAGR
jgi:hypothetical protein